jgi:hypothetical protein
MMKVSFLFSCAALLALASCASTPRNEPTPVSAETCSALGSFTLSADRIGLPTSGALVTGTQLVAASADAPEHCLVDGQVAPADRNAPNIEFRVALPTDWNGKVLMFGGSGYDGVIPNIADNLPIGADARAPLARGYATFGSDGGHQTPGASFALNEEAYRNYVGDALKKTRDTAVAIIEAAYGQYPTRSYFMGASRGGGEALAATARWPQDWDGAVSLYPARSGTVTILGMLAANQALAAPGAYLDVEDRALLYRAALERCDDLDGAHDGLISNRSACRTAFDPATATLNGAPLRCPSAHTAASNCLTDTQISALRKIQAPVRLPVPMNSGETEFPGYDIMTSESGSPGMAAFGWGTIPPSVELNPPAAYQPGLPILYWMVDQYTRYIFSSDPNYATLDFDFNNPGALGPRMKALSDLDDQDLDMSGFARRGGRLIMLQGTDDQMISSRATQAYYEMVRSRLGDAAFSQMMRYYEVPGYGHGDSAVFLAGWDQLTALENWVEQGTDPGEREVVTDLAGVPGRTRPLCLYPKWPRDNGRGDVNVASSFTCTR